MELMQYTRHVRFTDVYVLNNGIKMFGNFTEYRRRSVAIVRNVPTWRNHLKMFAELRLDAGKAAFLLSHFSNCSTIGLSFVIRIIFINTTYVISKNYKKPQSKILTSRPLSPPIDETDLR